MVIDPSKPTVILGDAKANRSIANPEEYYIVSTSGKLISNGHGMYPKYIACIGDKGNNTVLVYIGNGHYIDIDAF